MARTPPSDSASPHRSSSQPSKSSGSGSSWTTHPRRWRFIRTRLADRPTDRAHPFGHGKNVYFWAFVVSMLLFSVGGAFAIWEAVRKILPRCAHRLTRVDLWRPGSRVRLRTRVVRGRVSVAAARKG